MAKAIIVLEDDGTDDVRVTTTFEPSMDEQHASHRLAAAALTAMTEHGEDVSEVETTVEVKPQ